MFLQFKNANTIHYKKSLSSIVVKKMNTKKLSVHGSSVLTVRIFFDFDFLRVSIGIFNCLWRKSILLFQV